MTCKKCGAEYEGTSCPNGCTTQKQKKPIYKKWWFWLIIGIIVVSVISSGDSKTETSSGSAPVSQNETSPAQVETTAAPDPFYHVGDVIDANGLKITYVKAEKHKESNKYLQPEDGYMYIKLYLSA